MPPALLWLLREGALPLLGASIVYLVVRAGFRAAYNNPKGGKFKWSWEPAFDPVGWLYGAGLLAVQLGVASYPASPTLAVVFYGATGVCLVLLFASMHYRGEDQSWTPSPLLKFLALFMVVVVLGVGYFSKRGAADGGQEGAGTGASPAATGRPTGHVP
jgi:FtsH-binding integral membrane protein